MGEIILFGAILAAGIVITLVMKGKKRGKEALPPQNYDDKADRVVEQLHNL